MRADRLLSIMLLLQIHRRMTARELAARLEVSRRTVLRDMESLSAAGVPVTAERGAGGGWSLVEGYRTNLTGLSAGEIQALFLTGPPRLLADLKLDKASETGLIKLLAALPSVSRHDAEYVRQRIHVDVTGWGRTDETFPHLALLQDAVWRERKIYLTYGQSDDCAAERLADPLGLVAKGSVWYLVASVGGDLRSYRVSRVRKVRVTDEPCGRPAGFDLAAHWERASAEFKSKFPRYDATLRVHPDLIPRIYSAGRFARVEHVSPPSADGWSEVRMRFQFEWEAAEFALGFGPRAEVVEPDTLREIVLRRAESVVALYAPRQKSHSSR